MTFKLYKIILVTMKADFSKIIKDSIRITKSNKRLWVFGLVLASLGAGANFSSGGNIGDLVKEVEKQKPNTVIEQPIPQNYDHLEVLNSNLLTSNLPQILGMSDGRVRETISLVGLVKTVPYSFYASLIFLVLISIVVFIAVSLYAQSWAQSSVVYGIDKEDFGESLSLQQMSDKGKLNALEVIKIKILPGLAFVFIIITSSLILIIPGLLLGEVGKILLILFGIVWVIAIIVASIILGASINLGILAINLESLKWKVGFGRGFRIFKKFFVDYFIMSIINCFAGCVFGVASMIGLVILGVIGVASVFGAVAFPPFVVVAGPIIFLALLALIMFMGIVGAISAVFTQSTWVLFYKSLLTEQGFSANHQPTLGIVDKQLTEENHGHQ